MVRVFGIIAAGLSAIMALTGGAGAAGDPDAGKKIFARCAVCHNPDKATNKIGPHLGDVVGRTAGTASGFNYSPAMKEAGEKGIVWNDDNLNQYLTDPKSFVPGNRMAFIGLKKDDERADVIAYLEQISKQ